MRRLIATLACRLAGSRLYGKPLQNLDAEAGVPILQHQVNLLRSLPEVADVVLGIAEGRANDALIEFAELQDLTYIVGDEHDVLSRLIQCVNAVGGTDAIRLTTESPFTNWERLADSWRMHIEHANDVTVLTEVPVGSGFELFTVEALETSHREGAQRHRSELCSLYVREHLDDFKVQILLGEEDVRRSDIRLTADYPEDLIVCRTVYGALRADAPRIRLADIVRFLDSRQDLHALIAPYPSGSTWGSIAAARAESS
ncbi:MAG: acylneuraminate cytidylyltransferase [Coriobacteriia bacterium]|nr:acylneuraminate cytidylyltransferase [Coriobacteriia bacterium]